MDAAPPPTSLLARAAALRARGGSWETTAERLDCDPDELEQQAAADRKAYRRWLALAQNDVLDELFAEGVMILRHELRTPGDKAKARAAESLVRLWANVYRHRVKPRAKGEKAVDRAAGVSDLHLNIAKHVSGLSDEQLRRTEADLVEKWLREHPGWRPDWWRPADGDDGPASFGDGDPGPPPDPPPGPGDPSPFGGAGGRGSGEGSGKVAESGGCEPADVPSGQPPAARGSAEPSPPASAGRRGWLPPGAC